jgi:hypothetical protein
MIDVSGFGTGIVVLALQSFPFGFSLKQFADDVDPIMAKEVDAVGFEMLYDGDLFSFDKAAPIEVAVSVIPGSDDDMNLKILLQSKKGSSAILPLPDITSMVITYPDGGRVILSKGTILRGPLVDSILTNGRKKGNTYTFVFGAFQGAQSAKQLVAGIAQGAMDLL